MEEGRFRGNVIRRRCGIYQRIERKEKKEANFRFYIFHYSFPPILLEEIFKKNKRNQSTNHLFSD